MTAANLFLNIIVLVIGFFQWCYYMPKWKILMIVGIIGCYHFVSIGWSICAGLLLFELLLSPNEQ